MYNNNGVILAERSQGLCYAREPVAARHRNGQRSHGVWSSRKRCWLRHEQLGQRGVVGGGQQSPLAMKELSDVFFAVCEPAMISYARRCSPKRQ